MRRRERAGRCSSRQWRTPTRISTTSELDGGHVSYDVRPSERGRGYGTELLRLALVECRRLGLTRVLLTTAPDNERSIRVIRANGGVELDWPVSPFDGHRRIRWQISL